MIRYLNEGRKTEWLKTILRKDEKWRKKRRWQEVYRFICTYNRKLVFKTLVLCDGRIYAGIYVIWLYNRTWLNISRAKRSELPISLIETRLCWELNQYCSVLSPTYPATGLQIHETPDLNMKDYQERRNLPTWVTNPGNWDNWIIGSSDRSKTPFFPI